MEYDEFDSLEPQGSELVDDDEERHPTVDQSHISISLSWQQVAFIVAVNAIISLIISLAVVIIAGPGLPSQAETALLPKSAAPEMPPSPIVEAGGETSQTELSSLDTTAGATIPTAEPISGEASPSGTTVEPTTYSVQLGDTLGSIAGKFDISLDDLMRANGIDNPDYVQVGQVLLVPIGGLPEATPTFTPVPIPTDTPLPFNPPTPLPSGTAPPAEPAATVGPTPTPVPTLPSASGSEIRLVMQVLSPGEPGSEMVQIVNQGSFVRLTDWTLSDQEGNTYTFPDFSLWGGGAINVHTSAGLNTTTDLYWGQPNPVWKIDSPVILRNAEGDVIATIVVPGQ